MLTYPWAYVTPKGHKCLQPVHLYDNLDGYVMLSYCWVIQFDFDRGHGMTRGKNMVEDIQCIDKKQVTPRRLNSINRTKEYRL